MPDIIVAAGLQLGLSPLQPVIERVLMWLKPKNDFDSSFPSAKAGR
jgi:hypothetical protein